MRATALALLLGFGMALTPLGVAAQQKPIYGCNAAPSCRPLGFSMLNTEPGASGMFFGVGMSFGPGHQVYLVSPRDVSRLIRRPVPAPNRELFHLNVSLLSPTGVATPAPAPKPSPTPATPARPPGS